MKKKHKDKKIHVVDSRSASCGEAQIALKAMELEEQGLSFEEIVKRLEDFRDEMNTYFVLNNLETLRKNGRLTGVKALVASTLNIKPVMGATAEGTIIQLGQAIGFKKALQKLADTVVQGRRTLRKKMPYDHPLQQSGQGRERAADDSGKGSVCRFQNSGHCRNQQHVCQ